MLEQYAVNQESEKDTGQRLKVENRCQKKKQKKNGRYMLMQLLLSNSDKNNELL